MSVDFTPNSREKRRRLDNGAIDDMDPMVFAFFINALYFQISNFILIKDIGLIEWIF